MRLESSTENLAAPSASPRVCLCVLMNHPFPQNLPLLRRVYADRFSTVLFLIPFERTGEPDVITVYRGSYVHAAYITDARERLLATDCDFFIFVHDDVLLNPQLNERTFSDLFPIGPDDGYISRFGPAADHIGGWTWLFGCAHRALYPKSQLFGTGIEGSVLRKYLPNPGEWKTKLESGGLDVSFSIKLNHDQFEDVTRQPSRVLLHGLAAPLSSSPEQAVVDQECLAIEHRLVDVLARAAQLEERIGAVELPFPLLTSGYYADFYILPRSKLGDYAHTIGVASAANIFVELIVAGTLVMHCHKVWTADDLGLDLSGFEIVSDLDQFADPKFIAIHPYKFSVISSDEQRDEFLGRLTSIRERRPFASKQGTLGAKDVGSGTLDGWAKLGWHSGEGWGRWASKSPATIEFSFDPEGPVSGVQIRLVAPLHPKRPRLAGSASLNGGERRSFAAEMGGPAVSLIFKRSELRVGGNVIELFTDELVRPSEIDNGNTDTRALGFGLQMLNFF